MGRWDEREKAFDGDTPEEIIEDFAVAKVMMDCFQYKKRTVQDWFGSNL